MAVAGGATTAYHVEMKAGVVVPKQTSILRSLCTPPADAVSAVLRGEKVTVAGGDMGQFWLLLNVATSER